MNRIIFLCLSLAVLLPGFTEAADNPASLGYVETHVHLTAGARRGVRVTYLEAAAAVLKSMDELGVRKVLVLPPPQGPLNTRSIVGYESLKEVAKKYPDRFAFLGGGGSLNYMIYESVKKGTVSERTRRKFREEALAIAKAGAVGFGEMTALHFSLHSGHPFYEAPPDHPLFLLLSDLSAESGLPIDLHMEAVTKDAMPFPYDKRTRASKHNPSTLKENIKPLERLLSHNRKAKVVWVHMGWDNTGHMTVELLSRLLKAHPNLYMSLKGYSHKRSANRPLDQNDKLRSEWKNLIALFPDRFVFGCDGFYGLPGKDKTFPVSTGGSRLILSQLPLNIARKVAYKNANHIYGLKTEN